MGGVSVLLRLNLVDLLLVLVDWVLLQLLLRVVFLEKLIVVVDLCLFLLESILAAVWILLIVALLLKKVGADDFLQELPEFLHRELCLILMKECEIASFNILRDWRAKRSRLF